MQHLRPLLAALLLAIAAVPLQAQATAPSWVGSYQLEQGGHHGTLRLLPTKQRCTPAKCPFLEAQYSDEQGATYPATISALDQQGQHLAFTLSMPGNTQTFDLFAVQEPSLDGQMPAAGQFQQLARLAGTTVSEGRTLGVIATRIFLTRVGAKASAPAAGTKPVISTDGEIATTNSDGSTTYRKLGVCGGRTVTAAGRVVTFSCSQVPEAIPTDPPTANTEGQWLRRQDDALGSIIQALLDPASYKNYLANYESKVPSTMHEQITARTKYITQLTQTR